MIPALVSGGVVVIVVIAFSWWCAAQLRDAERRTAQARVSEADTKGKLVIMTADRDTQKLRGDYQERRADALDQELDTVALDDPDPVRARGRVLSKLRAAEAAGTAAGGDPGAVPGGEAKPDPEVAGQLDDALERPGD